MSHYRPLTYAAPPRTKAPEYPPMLRLRRAGLTPEEERVVMARWEAMTPAERIEATEAMEYWDNDELRRQVEEMRQEIAEEALTGVQPVSIEDVADNDAAINPDAVPDGPVQAVLRWVDGDVHRARAALVAEQRRHDPPRKTLVEPLEDLSGSR